MYSSSGSESCPRWVALALINHFWLSCRLGDGGGECKCSITDALDEEDGMGEPFSVGGAVPQGLRCHLISDANVPVRRFKEEGSRLTSQHGAASNNGWVPGTESSLCVKGWAQAGCRGSLVRLPRLLSALPALCGDDAPSARTLAAAPGVRELWQAVTDRVTEPAPLSAGTERGRQTR